MTDYPKLGLDDLLAEEERLRLGRCDEEFAWELGSRLVELARADSLPVTLAVSRADRLLFQAALPGSTGDQQFWIDRKRAVVHRFGHSSYYVGRTYTDRGAHFEADPHVDHLRYAAHGGGFPLHVMGVGLVGVVAVSGLPQDQDHALAVRALESLL
jgi:uncharacterized protein (UPF0303 family)